MSGEEVVVVALGPLAAHQAVDLVAQLVAAFLFSSRRRHTRCGRDWSSDVCSSDLRSPARPPSTPATPSSAPPGEGRSEERRVGKECRSRWSAYHQKKNLTAVAT